MLLVTAGAGSDMWECVVGVWGEGVGWLVDCWRDGGLVVLAVAMKIGLMWMGLEIVVLMVGLVGMGKGMG